MREAFNPLTRKNGRAIKRAPKHERKHAKMINEKQNLIGPAAAVLSTVRALVTQREKIAILLDGNPGCGKSHLSDALALELTKSKFAIETVNGQSLKVDLVRDWRNKACYGNLFSDWTVKRIDELDQSHPSAQAELLTYLDYLPARMAVLATTNDYAGLRAISKGRLETRFVRLHVDSPSVSDAAAYLEQAFRISPEIAREIAKGAVPEGCLISEGVNMRACIRDAEGYLAAKQAA